MAGCQVSTPAELIRQTWDLVLERRQHVPSVLDLGAGDARFSRQGRYGKYLAVEIDRRRFPTRPTRKTVTLREGCVLDVSGHFDLCIGNPPYIRHQDLDAEWKTRADAVIKRELGVQPDGRSNAYLYFLWLALVRTGADGLCALVVPFDWVGRPAAASFRDYLKQRRWRVDALKLGDAEFSGVKTTASITLIDKAEPRTGTWTIGAADTRLLKYCSRRPAVYAWRGLSTGSQAVFILTDSERKAAGIRPAECTPCVTSLRDIPRDLDTLTAASFRRYFVTAGRRCWLLRTNKTLSRAVRAWLEAAPIDVQTNSTCRVRDTWFAYELPGSPHVLYGSGFHGTRPHFVRNTVGAVAAGAVHGIHGAITHTRLKSLLALLRHKSFAGRLLPHAGGLLKLDVRQMNGLLGAFCDAKENART